MFLLSLCMKVAFSSSHYNAQADRPLPVPHPPPHHIRESPGALKGTHKELTVGGQINPPQLNNRGALNCWEVDGTRSVFVMEMSQCGCRILAPGWFISPLKPEIH